MSKEPFRAYWFDLEPTDTIVDEVLSAVARAGKAYHSTAYWCDGDENGTSHIDLIQAAANDVAQRIAALQAEVAEVKRERDELAAKVIKWRTKRSPDGVMDW